MNLSQLRLSKGLARCMLDVANGFDLDEVKRVSIYLGSIDDLATNHLYLILSLSKIDGEIFEIDPSGDFSLSDRDAFVIRKSTSIGSIDRCALDLCDGAIVVQSQVQGRSFVQLFVRFDFFQNSLAHSSKDYEKFVATTTSVVAAIEDYLSGDELRALEKRFEIFEASALSMQTVSSKGDLFYEFAKVLNKLFDCSHIEFFIEDDSEDAVSNCRSFSRLGNSLAEDSLSNLREVMKPEEVPSEAAIVYDSQEKVATPSLSLEFVDRLGALGDFRSIAIVPISLPGQRPIGSAVIASATSFAFSRLDLMALGAFSSQVTLAVLRLDREWMVAWNWSFASGVTGKTSLRSLLDVTTSALGVLSSGLRLAVLLDGAKFIERPRGITGYRLLFIGNGERIIDLVDFASSDAISLRIVQLLGEDPVSDEADFIIQGRSILGVIGFAKIDGSKFSEIELYGLRQAVAQLNPAVASISSSQLEASTMIRQREDDALFATIVQAMSELVWAISDDGRIVWASPSHREVLGLSPSLLEGRRMSEVIQYHGGTEKLGHRDLLGAMDQLLFEIEDHRGNLHLLEAVANRLPVIHSSGATTVVSARDVTERRKMEREVEESESRYRSIVEASGQGIWVVSLDGRVTYANRAMEALIDRDASEIVGCYVSDFLDATSATDPTLEWGSGDSFPEMQHELVLVRGDGKTVHGLAKISPIRDSLGNVISRITVVADISRHKENESELEAALERDSLTGLLNRRGAEKGYLEIVSHLDDGRIVALFFLDLDRFKLINDTRGHLVGDRLLMSVAKRMISAGRDQDVVARLGGDEFIVVAGGFKDQAGAEAFGVRIARNFARPFVIDGEDYFSSASIGVATGFSDTPWDELLRDADTAMYKAKESRSSKVAFFDKSFRSSAERRMVVEAALRQSLSRDEIHMAYQPILDIQSGLVAGYESLMRWTNKKLGSIGPDEFIPIAEDSGLIHLHGAFALSASVSALRTFQAFDPRRTPFIAVNVSMRQLETGSRRSFVDLIASKNLMKGELVLEITESEMMRYPSEIAPLLRDLQSIGVLISIDDFGTGYSSLAQLSSLAPDIVKIDKQFVAKLESDESRQIASAIVAMCDALGVSTVAEGVETKMQLELLASIGCTFAQGYFIAPALEEISVPIETEIIDSRFSDILGSRTIY